MKVQTMAKQYTQEQLFSNFFNKYIKNENVIKTFFFL